MIITLSIFYYLFLVAVAVFLLYSLFNVYHLLRFGFFSLINVLVIVLYVLIAASFLYFSFSILMTVDWSTPLIDFGNMSNNPF
ncbi:MAG: hypothetical protein AAB358_00530 [Patescibacteria group bacterium]